MQRYTNVAQIFIVSRSSEDSYDSQMSFYIPRFSPVRSPAQDSAILVSSANESS